MSDKSKICAIGEKKLIGGKWYEKARATMHCRGCVFMEKKCMQPTPPSADPQDAIEDGGAECTKTIWIACDQPQPETPAVEECAGCRAWKALDQFQQTGDCRRYPPIQRGTGLAEFPETRRDMWCGEWKA